MARAKRIKLRDNFICQNKRCGVVTDQLQVDHRVPICQGGDEKDSNCRALCVPCHAIKSALESNGMQCADPDDFATNYDDAKREHMSRQDEDGVSMMEIISIIDKTSKRIDGQ